ncbi:S8 family peptidase [Paenibacillus polysaccharolyticus]|uniref:S8 family peptidase n=1 Tax=Paenibacillus polysaccharolyticus TaxID=582692 RepID=UPI0020A11770|nr:S8 family peptidase [Paenibacillus polysaccharolyticus]MCP1136293.1 S8 family peptidase [Paenibacillus polysaccharolyticus]
MDNQKYPAKLVSFRANDYQKGKVPGSFPGIAKWEYNHRNEIIRHLTNLKNQLLAIYESYIPSARIKLKYPDSSYPIVIYMKKLAKSHRPDGILKTLESEVIAVHALGKLVVGITEDSLLKFIQLIVDLTGDIPTTREAWITHKPDKSGTEREAIVPGRERDFEWIHELTSIEHVKTYSPSEVLEAMSSTDMQDCIKDGEFKIRFFQYDNDNDQIVRTQFNQTFKLNEKEIRPLSYSPELSSYVVPFINIETIHQMAAFPGVESITSFTRFRVTSSTLAESTTFLEIIQPESEKSYPRVAIVDSGIGKENNHITPWVEEREIFVPFNRQDNYHGEFVGGMLVYAHNANPTLKNIVDTGVKILDVVVLPAESQESIREDELIDALETALEKYAETYKVWNLSLGSSRLCSGVISDFTASIDKLQDTYQVNFVIAAGNFVELRQAWPVTSEDEMDRICLPADSIRAVTVGSIALNHDDTNLVKQGETAPYSRRGPGIGLAIKPDVVHYSGNPRNYPIQSINSNGAIVEDYGTSFSAPLVSAIMAEYYEQYPGQLSKTMAKALLIHGSKHPLTEKCIEHATDHYYYGFGLPSRIHDVLNGNEHEITLVFEGRLNAQQNRNWVQISDFPFPESLKAGENKIRGEILVTLVYEPHLNPRLGSEYCRGNVDIRLRTLLEDGSYETISKGSSAGEINQVERWEKNQMTKELKWSPAKQLSFISPRGKKGSTDLRLDLFPTWRDITDKQAIPFAIVVTIRDPKKMATVYTDVSRSLLKAFQANDLKLRYTPTRITNKSR